MKKTFLLSIAVGILLAACHGLQSAPTESSSITAGPSSIPISIPTASSTPALGTVVSTYYSRQIFESGSEIYITNSGDVPARNLKVSICLTQINSHWHQDVQDISSLLVEPEDSFFKFSQKNLYYETCQPNLENNEPNVLLFQFATLPVKQDIHVKIKMNSNTKVSEKAYKGRVFIKIPANLSSGDIENEILNSMFGKYGDALIYSFGRKWAIATLYLKIECDNCLGSEKMYSYSFYKDMSVAGCKLLAKDNSFVKTVCNFSFSYYIPENSSDFLPEREDLYFLATQNTDERNSLIEISNEQFGSNTQ